MRSCLVVALLSAALLPGCLSSPGGQTASGDSSPAEWPFPFAATCDDATIAFLDDLNRLQGLLPSGFTAADAAGFLGVPAPTGMGLIAVTTADCTESSLAEGAFGEAEVAMLVEPPRLAGAEVEAGAIATTYFAAVYVSSETYHARVSAWGHDMVVASVSNEVADPPQSGPMTLVIADGEGEVARFTAVLPGREPTEAGFTDNWQATDTGLLHYRLDLSHRDFGAGTSVTCSIREGTRMHDLLGFTDCKGRTAHALGETADSYQGTWTHFPGAFVKDGDA